MWQQKWSALEIFVYGFLYPVLAMLAVMVVQHLANTAYRTYERHLFEEESSVEWLTETPARIARAEQMIRTSAFRCSNYANTVDLAREHKRLVERYQRAVMRYAVGSQYRGIETTLPQPIREIDCGKIQIHYPY